ncbi:MAG: ParA family protein [Planctomycetota bacterium]|nr:ParA family protein [Planctomycetota bacterium]
MNGIAVINQKGGVGKTTSVANLGAALAARGHRVCLIDMDPQSHLTLHMGVEPGSSALTIYDVLTGDTPIGQAAMPLPGRDRLSLVPSVIDLAAAEVELAGTVGREQILRERLNAAGDLGDFVLIDCPPSLSVLTLNSLAAAQNVLIPLQPQFLALQGLGKLLETIRLVQQRINTALRVAGVILCMYDSTTKLTGEVVAEVTDFFQAGRGSQDPWADAAIFQAAIRRNIKLAECPSHGKTIFEYAPGTRGADDYDALAGELLHYFNPQAEPVPPAPEPPSTPEPDDSVAQPPLGDLDGAE